MRAVDSTFQDDTTAPGAEQPSATLDAGLGGRYRGNVRRSSLVLVLGLVFLLLGAGNWAFGGDKMSEYKQRRRFAVQMGGPEVKERYRGTLGILEKRSSANDLFEDADIKYEYYRVIARGGRMMTITGAVLMLGALARRLAVRSPS